MTDRGVPTPKAVVEGAEGRKENPADAARAEMNRVLLDPTVPYSKDTFWAAFNGLNRALLAVDVHNEFTISGIGEGRARHELAVYAGLGIFKAEQAGDTTTASELRAAKSGYEDRSTEVAYNNTERDELRGRMLQNMTKNPSTYGMPRGRGNS